MTIEKKRITRRTFLKGAGAAAAGVTLGGKFATQGMFKPNVVHAQNTVVLAVQQFAHEAIQAVLPDFEAATGLTVTLETGPVSGLDMLTKYSTAFAAGNSPVDVVSDADDSGPTFYGAGWMLPLDDVIPQESWDDLPESFDGQIEKFHSLDGVRYRFPHEFAIGLFWTRKDWLDEKGVAAPTTWDELVETGKMFTDSANELWGTTDGLIKPGLLGVFVMYLTAQAGGSIFDFDDGVATALQFLYDLIYTHKVFPETSLNQDYNAQNQLYMEDKIAFMRQWPYFYGVTSSNTDWFAPEKIQLELPPAGPAGSKSWWGGWGWSVPKFAPNIDGAKELIKFITSNEVAPKLAQGQSWFIVPRKSVLAVMADHPMVIAEGKYADADVPAPRPYHPRYAEAATIVDDMTSLFLTKQASLSEVLKNGKELIDELSAE
jgi:ABC-type glycerol-3-phosphate transport system substrate-binding protein